MGGLWKKHDHEKGSRREKANKEPYSEDFAEPAIQSFKKQQELFSYQFTNSGPTVKISKSFAAASLRKDALKNFRRRIQSRVFVVNGHKFSYSWTEDQFADANGLAREKAAEIRADLRLVIKQKCEFAERRINRAQIEEGNVTDDATGLSHRVYQLTCQLDDLFGFPD